MQRRSRKSAARTAANANANADADADAAAPAPAPVPAPASPSRAKAPSIIKCANANTKARARALSHMAVMARKTELARRRGGGREEPEGDARTQRSVGSIVFARADLMSCLEDRRALLPSDHTAQMIDLVHEVLAPAEIDVRDFDRLSGSVEVNVIPGDDAEFNRVVACSCSVGLPFRVAFLLDVGERGYEPQRLPPRFYLAFGFSLRPESVDSMVDAVREYDASVPVPPSDEPPSARLTACMLASPYDGLLVAQEGPKGAVNVYPKDSSFESFYRLRHFFDTAKKTGVEIMTTKKYLSVRYDPAKHAM